jgi:flagellin
MPIRVNNSPVSILSRDGIGSATESLGYVAKKFATGQKFAKPSLNLFAAIESATGKAKLAYTESAKANLVRLRAILATRNGALETMRDGAQALADISLQSAGNLPEDVRSGSVAVFNQVLDRVRNIAETADYGGIKLLNGTFGASGDFAGENPVYNSFATKTTAAQGNAGSFTNMVGSAAVPNFSSKSITVANALNGDTITVNGVEYTLKTLADPEVDTDIQLGSNNESTAFNIAKALNESTDDAVKEFVFTAAADIVTATRLAGSRIAIAGIVTSDPAGRLATANNNIGLSTGVDTTGLTHDNKLLGQMGSLQIKKVYQGNAADAAAGVLLVQGVGANAGGVPAQLNDYIALSANNAQSRVAAAAAAAAGVAAALNGATAATVMAAAAAGAAAAAALQPAGTEVTNAIRDNVARYVTAFGDAAPAVAAGESSAVIDGTITIGEQEYNTYMIKESAGAATEMYCIRKDLDIAGADLRGKVFKINFTDAGAIYTPDVLDTFRTNFNIDTVATSFKQTRYMNLDRSEGDIIAGNVSIGTLQGMSAVLKSAEFDGIRVSNVTLSSSRILEVKTIDADGNEKTFTSAALATIVTKGTTINLTDAVSGDVLTLVMGKKDLDITTELNQESAAASLKRALGSAANSTFIVGTDVEQTLTLKLGDMSWHTLVGSTALKVDTQENAKQATVKLDLAVDSLNNEIALNASYDKAVDSLLEQMQVSSQNLSASVEELSTIDIAETRQELDQALRIYNSCIAAIFADQKANRVLEGLLEVRG